MEHAILPVATHCRKPYTCLACRACILKSCRPCKHMSMRHIINADQPALAKAISMTLGFCCMACCRWPSWARDAGGSGKGTEWQSTTSLAAWPARTAAQGTHARRLCQGDASRQHRDELDPQACCPGYVQSLLTAMSLQVQPALLDHKNTKQMVLVAGPALT